MALQFIAKRQGWYLYPIYILDEVSTGAIAEIAGGNNLRKALFVFEDGETSWYCETKSSGKVGEYFLNKLIEDENFQNEVIENIYSKSEVLTKFCENLKEIDFESLSDEKLIRIYGEYVETIKALRVWGWVPPFLEGFGKAYLTDYLQDNLKKFLEEKNISDNFAEYYSILSSSEKISEVQKEELARLELLINLNGKVDFDNPDDKLSQALENHLNEFDWLTYDYSGPAMSRDYLIDLLKDNLDKGDLEKQKIELENHYKELKNKKQKLYKKLNLDKNLKRIFEVSAEFMYIKNFRKGVYQKSYLMMDNVLEEIGKRLNLSLKEMKFLTLSETKEALTNNQKEKYQRIVSQRLKKCCYVAKNGNIMVYQGKDGEKIIRENLAEVKKEKIDSRKELKGLVAYNGKKKGIAKLILSVEDIPKIQEGEILVSPSTNPDLIMAMKKAGAFITETGGIISHAAIVSRELKKPCLVSVKNVTEIIKDGDLVEVDADKGVVTIIN